MNEAGNLKSINTKYGVTILILIVIAILSQFAGLTLFTYIAIAFIVLLGIRYFGIILGLLGFELFSKVVKLFLAYGAFAFVIEFILLAYAYISISALDPAYSLFPFFTLTLWPLMLMLASDRYILEKTPFISEFFKKLSVFFMFLAISLFSYYYSYANIDLLVLYPAFLYLSISSFIFAFFPILSNSPDDFKRSIGEYISSKYIKWEIAAFILGFFQGILAVPKPASENSDILVILLFLIVIAIVSGIWSTYKAGTDNILYTQLGFYEKFQKHDNVVSDIGVDYMSKAIDEFVATGKKEKLILSITSYLTKLNNSEMKVEEYLKGIMSYKNRNLSGYGITSKNAIIRNEMKQRNLLVRAMILTIKRSIGEENAEKQ
jgi:uncharacterized protein YxeA